MFSLCIKPPCAPRRKLTVALQWYERARALSPTSSDVIIALGFTQHLAGRTDEAVVFYHEVRALFVILSNLAGLIASPTDACRHSLSPHTTHLCNVCSLLRCKMRLPRFAVPLRHPWGRLLLLPPLKRHSRVAQQFAVLEVDQTMLAFQRPPRMSTLRSGTFLRASVLLSRSRERKSRRCAEAKGQPPSVFP